MSRRAWSDPPPDGETVEVLKARRWQARHRVLFHRGELEEAGRELVAAAPLIGQLDSGALHPLRTSRPWTGNGCDHLDNLRRLELDLVGPAGELAGHPPEKRTSPSIGAAPRSIGAGAASQPRTKSGRRGVGLKSSDAAARRRLRYAAVPSSAVRVTPDSSRGCGSKRGSYRRLSTTFSVPQAGQTSRNVSTFPTGS